MMARTQLYHPSYGYIRFPRSLFYDRLITTVEEICHKTCVTLMARTAAN